MVDKGVDVGLVIDDAVPMRKSGIRELKAVCAPIRSGRPAERRTKVKRKKDDEVVRGMVVGPEDAGRLTRLT
jgi:hypothetical protein